MISLILSNTQKVRMLDVMNGSFSEQIRSIMESLFAVDSFWSVIIRFVIWGVIAMTIIISVDTVRSDQRSKNLKSNLGLFLLFLILGAVLIWLLFGFIPSF